MILRCHVSVSTKTITQGETRRYNRKRSSFHTQHVRREIRALGTCAFMCSVPWICCKVEYGWLSRWNVLLLSLTGLSFFQRGESIVGWGQVGPPPRARIRTYHTSAWRALRSKGNLVKVMNAELLFSDSEGAGVPRVQVPRGVGLLRRADVLARAAALPPRGRRARRQARARAPGERPVPVPAARFWCCWL